MSKASIYAISISPERGQLKKEVDSAKVIENHGIEKDGHAGNWSRQVTCLDWASFKAASSKHNINFNPGDFAENILIDGLDFTQMTVGSRLRLGLEVILEVSQIGKEAHPSIVSRTFGVSLLPHEGLFCSVISGGEIHKGDPVEVVERKMRENMVQDHSVHSDLALKMMAYYAGDAQRINHFVKVHGFARFIGSQAGLDEHEQETLEAAALVHDIGIKISLEKYGSSAGHYQELEGPPIARIMLSSLGYPDPMVDRICYLVGHHHTYGQIEGNDYQILVEADFLVNVIEHAMSDEQIASIRERIFKTAAGRSMLERLTNHNEKSSGTPA